MYWEFPVAPTLQHGDDILFRVCKHNVNTEVFAMGCCACFVGSLKNTGKCLYLLLWTIS